MILTNEPTNEEWKRKKKLWSKWFAWFPVRVGTTPNNYKIKAWLQYVERRGIFYNFSVKCHHYEYKLLKNKGGEINEH